MSVPKSMLPGALLAGLNRRGQSNQTGGLNATAGALSLLLGVTLASPILASIINATIAGATTSLAPVQADQCSEQITTPTNVSAHHLASIAKSDEHLYVRLSTFWYCFLASVTSLGLLVSLVSNMIIIYLFTNTPSLRKNPSNIIAVNLSLSDLLYCIQWPSVIYCSLTQTTWLLEIDYVCQIFGFITLITASASILTVLAMSIERAIVIRYSLHVRNRFAMRHAWLVLLLIWATSISISVPPLFGTFNKYTLDPSKTSCTLDYLSSKPNYKLYTLVLYIAYWFVPTVIISICYALIIRTFGSSSRSLTLAGAGRRVSSRAAATATATAAATAQQTASDIENRLEQDDTIRRQTRLFSQSCELTSAGERSLQRHAQPLESSLSLRSTSRESRLNQRRAHPSRLRDSIRLQNFMGQLARGSPASSQVVRLKHKQLDKMGLNQMTRQVSSDNNDEDEEEEAEGEARNRLAVTSLSLCTSSTLEDDHTHLASELSELQLQLDLEPSSTSTMRHRVDSTFAQMLPIHQKQVQQKQNAWLLGKPLSWCCPKRSINSQASSPPLMAVPAPAPMKSSRFSFDASARSKTCYELSSLRSPPDAGRRTTNLNMSVSTLGRVRHANPSGAARASRPRLGSMSCHFGVSGAHLSRTSIQIRLAKMSFYLILLWLISWTPIASLAVINSLVKCQHRASALAVFLANTMTKLGPAFDVFIYGISHPKIKKKFRQIIGRLFMFRGSAGASCASIESERRADSFRDRNASVRSKSRRPNASLAVY